MNISKEAAEITLPEAAMLLRLRWHSCHSLMCSGALGTPRKVGGQWRLAAAAVEAYRATRPEQSTT